MWMNRFFFITLLLVFFSNAFADECSLRRIGRYLENNPDYRPNFIETGYQLDLFRPFGENDRMPEDSELPEAERGKDRKWKRLIGGAKINKAPSWDPGKGRW